jgi:hypothetical protein
MKKFMTVIAWTLALNFLAGVGGVVWLYKSGKLDHEKVHQIKELVFTPATQPVEVKPEVRDPSTQPTLRLEEMLAKVSGRSASEQIEFIQKSVSAQMAILDRRFQDLQDQRRTLDQAKAQADKDREKLRAAEKKLADAQAAQNKLLTDEGFQSTLEIYNTMPAKQVKGIFMTMTDDTMIQYFKAMEARTVTKIAKEFKSPEESQRIAKVMEKMRQSQASAKE